MSNYGHHRAFDVDICLHCPLSPVTCESSSQGTSIAKVKRDYKVANPVCLRDFALVIADGDGRPRFDQFAAVAPVILDPDRPETAEAFKSTILKLKQQPLGGAINGSNH